MEFSDLYALMSVHKAEEAAAIGYLAAYTAVVLGILGYLGAFKKIAFRARIGAAIFALFALVHISTLEGTYSLHDAIHGEIAVAITQNSHLALTDTFRGELESQGLPPLNVIIGLHLFLDVVMLVVILGSQKLGIGKPD